jgi:hypothetical protein
VDAGRNFLFVTLAGSRCGIARKSNGNTGETIFISDLKIVLIKIDLDAVPTSPQNSARIGSKPNERPLLATTQQEVRLAL